jgi:hypothetical protein
MPPAAGVITAYQAIQRPFLHPDGTLRVAVRHYRQQETSRYLVLDPQRYRFEVWSAASLAERPAAPEPLWLSSPFSQALARHTAPPFPLQNDGLVRANAPIPGFFLTADLCPSRRPLDRAFLEALSRLPLARPVPVALMVSGLWLERHREDLAWIQGEIAAGKLAVTWGNHSESHHYDPQAPLEENFLLRPGTDFLAEVLRLEQRLLEAGLLPSPFFRFPGLVSAERLVVALQPLSLIPVGADAWLAKGEVPSPGSIILVHGNGNEPEGIRLLQAFFAAQEKAFLQGKARLMPLAAAVGLPAPPAFPPPGAGH